MQHGANIAIGNPALARRGSDVPPQAPPDAFEAGDWSLSAGDTEATVTISSLPADNGASITDVEYSVDAGGWVSSGGVVSFDITGLTNGTEIDVRLRAINSGGASAASDTKSVTPVYTVVNSEASTLIAAMSVAPTEARKELIDDTIGALKSAGIWNKLDRLWFMAAHDVQAARLNWKIPGGTGLSLTNSPVFTADQGFSSDGSTSRLGTGINLAGAGVNFTLNSCCAFTRFTTSFAGGVYMALSGRDATSRIEVEPFRSTGAPRVSVNTTGSLAPAVPTGSSTSLVVGNRSSANDTQVYSDGTLANSNNAQASINVPNIGVALLCMNNNNAFSNFCPVGAKLGVAGLGGSLNGTEQAALDTIIDNYLVNL